MKMVTIAGIVALTGTQLARAQCYQQDPCERNACFLDAARAAKARGDKEEAKRLARESIQASRECQASRSRPAPMPSLYVGSGVCSSPSRSEDPKTDCWCSKPPRPVCELDCCKEFSSLKPKEQVQCEKEYGPAYDSYGAEFRRWHARCAKVDFTERILKLPLISEYDSLTTPSLERGIVTSSNAWAGVYQGFKFAGRVPGSMMQADTALQLVHVADIGIATVRVRGAVKDWQKDNRQLQTDCLYDIEACDNAIWTIGHNARLLEIEQEHDIKRAKSKILGVFSMPNSVLFPRSR